MDFAQHLKSSIDIAEIIRERVPLRRAGNTNSYKGLCPFHTEKTPSFTVNTKIQRYKCFGCQASGDVIKFVMEMNNMTFMEALKMLAERYGIPMPQRSEHADRESRVREALYRMNDIAQQIFTANLHSAQGAETRRYIAERAVSKESVEEFGLGLSDRTGNAVTQALQREGFSQELLEQSGLILKRQEGGGFFDRFRGRLMFPIHNETGKIAGFAGRALAKGDEPKYLNSPETEVYRKSRLLYNMNRAKEEARKNGRFILVEGYMDVIGLSAAGIKETVASCGTALTNDQVRLMKRFADRVTVNFDPDAGGNRGAERSIDLMLQESVRIKILEFTQDLDPDEYIQQFGVEKYQLLLDRAPNYYYWLADQLRKRHEKSAEGRTKVMQQLLPAVLRIPDKIERAALADDLAAYLNVEKGLLLDQFKKAAIDRREQRMEVRGPTIRSVEKLLLGTIIFHPELRDELIPQLQNNPAVNEFRTRPLFEAILALFQHQPDFRFEDLEARVDETAQALLSSIVFADELQESENADAARSNALSCLRVLQQEQHSVGTSDLRRQIKEAEQRGDFQTAMQLASQLDTRRKPAPMSDN